MAKQVTAVETATNVEETGTMGTETTEKERAEIVKALRKELKLESGKAMMLTAENLRTITERLSLGTVEIADGNPATVEGVQVTLHTATGGNIVGQLKLNGKEAEPRVWQVGALADHYRKKAPALFPKGKSAKAKAISIPSTEEEWLEALRKMQEADIAEMRESLNSAWEKLKKERRQGDVRKAVTAMLSLGWTVNPSEVADKSNGVITEEEVTAMIEELSTES